MHWRWLTVLSGLAGVLALVVCPMRTASAAPATRQENLKTIKRTEPGFYVRASVDRADHQYREGDTLVVNVVCERDAYVYALYQQADGRIFQVFPNASQPENHVRAKTQVTIPAADDLFRWKIAAPFGTEMVKVIASEKPLTDLDDKALRAKFFNVVPAEKVRDTASTIAKATGPWTEDQVEITTHPSNWQVARSAGKRFGVFFGVSEYKYNEVYRSLAPGKREMNLPTPADNAVTLVQCLDRQGGLSNSRVFLDDQATASAMEEAITEWLPAVSQPGDTVFIFFSGHGDTVADTESDRPRLGYLLTHEFVSPSLVKALRKKEEDGSITSHESELLATWMDWLTEANTDDQIAETLARKTGVPDDLFGHWLQRLEGRQVIVLLDSCRSGAFADEGKTLGRQNPPFKFLEGQLGRLKGLGQGEVALLSACGSREVTWSPRRPDEELKELRSLLMAKGVVESTLPENTRVSVFTYYVLESLLADPAPLAIETVYEHCQRGIKDYVEKLNASHLATDGGWTIPAYSPRLFNHCTKPVILKPKSD